MKVSKPFVFKQFTVVQDKCALKVNTDAVLLGALASGDNPTTILDIGTGTGVISLMLAQRYDKALIQGVEIEENAFFQTQENFHKNPYSDRMKAFHMPFQQLSKFLDTKYDLIVSNPPYYTDHLKTNNKERNIALHSDTLSFDELSAGVKEMLNDNGKFFAILPERQMKYLEKSFAERGMHVHSRITIFDKPETKTLRVIQSFGFKLYAPIKHKQIIIKDDTGKYSAEYASLLKDFLLIF